MGSPSFDFRLAFSDQEKEEVKMQIYEYKTVLAGDGRNVLVREADGTVSITGHRMICSVCES